MACCGDSPAPSPAAKLALRTTEKPIRVRVTSASEEAKMRKKYEGWAVDRQTIGAGAAILTFRRV